MSSMINKCVANKDWVRAPVEDYECHWRSDDHDVGRGKIAFVSLIVMIVLMVLVTLTQESSPEAKSVVKGKSSYTQPVWKSAS